MPARWNFACLSLLATASLLSCLSGCNTMSGYTMNRAGTAAYRRGNLPLAQANFQRAVYDDPTNPDYYSNLAATLRKSGDYPRSEQMYQQALRLDRSHQPSYHGLASLLLETGRNQDAVSLIDGWTSTQPYLAQAHIEQGWLKRELGDNYGAEQSMRQALQIQPNNSVALAHLGQIHQDRGDNLHAIAYYQQSLRNDFSQPQVQARLSQLRGQNRSASFNTQMASRPFYQMYPNQVAWIPSSTPIAAAPQPTLAEPSPTPVATQPKGAPAQSPPLAVEPKRNRETTYLNPPQQYPMQSAPTVTIAPTPPFPQQVPMAPAVQPVRQAPPASRPVTAAYSTPVEAPRFEPITQTSSMSSTPGPILFAPGFDPAPVPETPAESLPLVTPH